MNKLPTNMLLVRIDVPDTLKIETIDFLPAEPAAFRQMGDEWLEHNQTAILRVPSILVPRQWNILLNPAHPLFPAISLADQTPFAFDSRLLSSLPNP